jgi:hypothetical protein
LLGADPNMKALAGDRRIGWERAGPCSELALLGILSKGCSSQEVDFLLWKAVKKEWTEAVGAASFVARQGGLAPRNDQPTYRKHFRVPPFANHAKDGPPTVVVILTRSKACSTDQQVYPTQSKINTAEAMTVVQRPRLSPTADCVTFAVRTILLERR